MRYALVFTLVLSACNSATDSTAETVIVAENVLMRTPTETALDACVEKASDPEKDCARELAADEAEIGKNHAKSDAEIVAISREMDRNTKCIQTNLPKELANNQRAILEARSNCGIE